MSFSQADRFERHLTNQLSKWLGAIPVLMPIFRRLKVKEIVDEHCPGKEEVSHGTVCLALGLNRLMAPKPLYKVKGWMAETILEDALGVPAEQMHDTRLGRTLDDLYPHLEAIWQDIAVQAVLEYDVDLRFLHYDITSLYFEGQYEESEKVDYGYSRDKRPDAKQVNLAVNVTGKEGIPLGYQVLAGRTADRTTPMENMKTLCELLNRPELAEWSKDFLLVSDRAMLDREVIVAYEEKQIRWLGPLNADEALLELMRSVSDEELAAHPLDYRPANQPEDEPLRYQGVLRSETIKHQGKIVSLQILVVKSRTKVKLDRERRQTYLDRLTGRLDEIQRMLNTRRYKRKAYTWIQIEKARRGNPTKGFVDIELTGEDGNLKLTYLLNQEKWAQAEAIDGRYLLGTNDRQLSALQMLTHFKGQEVVERRIKTVKGPIQIRPMFLHKEERIEGLVFISMVALLVYTILEMLCYRVEQLTTARQVLEKFERLGAVYIQFNDGSQLKLPSALSPFQQQLIELLRFPQPEVYLRPSEALQ
jgi:transposase